LALYEEIEPPRSNIVVFTQQLEERDELSTYDPHGDLPRNQDSWRDQTG